VNLSAPANAVIGREQGIVRIINEHPLPLMTIEDVRLVEGNTGTTVAVRAVRLAAPCGLNANAFYWTMDGTATAGVDYLPTSGVVAFAAGETNQTITVQVIGDLFNESDETFLVALTGAAHASIGRDQAVVTILNDDSLPTLSINDVRVVEGNSGTTP